MLQLDTTFGEPLYSLANLDHFSMVWVLERNLFACNFSQSGVESISKELVEPLEGSLDFRVIVQPLGNLFEPVAVGPLHMLNVVMFSWHLVQHEVVIGLGTFVSRGLHAPNLIFHVFKIDTFRGVVLESKGADQLSEGGLLGAIGVSGLDVVVAGLVLMAHEVFFLHIFIIPFRMETFCILLTNHEVLMKAPIGQIPRL